MDVPLAAMSLETNIGKRGKKLQSACSAHPPFFIAGFSLTLIKLMEYAL